MWVETDDRTYLIRYRTYKVPTHSEIHGSRFCLGSRRFFCVVCWQLACWCKGVGDDVDVAIGRHYSVEIPTGDAGICNDCFVHLARGHPLELCIEGEEEAYGQKAV